ncbi:MAG: HAD-IA family hydrolase [Paracoccaceae bacterium]|nr:HAD-IA family hydrolase [Paracoccaceae bacterium]
MKTVIFDLDGTLADTSADLIAAANAAFRMGGHDVALDPVADALTAFHGGRAMLRLGFSRLAGGWDEGEIDRLYPLLLEYYGNNINRHTRLYDGVVEMLDALAAAGMALGICTNKPESLAETLVRELGIRDYFGALLGADSIAVKKPDPEHLLETVRRVGGDAGNAVLVGDTVTDRAAGRAAGVPVVLVTFGPAGQGVAALEPEALLDHYRDLPGVLERLGTG